MGLGLTAVVLAGAGDWLLGGSYPAEIRRTGTEIVLSNGLIERRVNLNPFTATTSLRRADTGEEFLRSLEPEGRLVVDGKRVDLGGSTPLPNRAFMRESWLSQLKASPDSIPFEGAREAEVQAPIPWKVLPGQAWPPKGKAAILEFRSQELRAEVRLEIYDGLPVIGKQVTVWNTGSKPIRVDAISSERLAMVEGESRVETASVFRRPNVGVFTSMSFNGMNMEGANQCVHWEVDPEFGTQVNYELKTPCILDVHPPLGPAAVLQPGESLSSPRSFLLLHDTDERERCSLGIRRTFRVIAPWTQDSPLMLHIRASDDPTVKSAIDQAAECGFEMAILSFGSGLNMEDISEENIRKYKALREYADSKGIRLGGYSLLASRRIDDANDVINKATGKPGGAIFGNSPCLGSEWGQEYFRRIKTFIEQTGFRMLEHDGSYPGDPCASTSHPGHKGYEDSIWKQYRVIEDFYRWCRERNIFLNVPDTYYLAGSNKNGMGYRETNWSLPRDQQHIHARQNLFDGTFEKTPSMGWMFVPLVEYQGGGAAATIEPLKDHLSDYEQHFANNLGFGAQACWRGTRLYDSPETKAMVVRMVKWFKDRRQILEADVIHLRRANGRGIDCILHVNPGGNPQGMLVAYNPTQERIVEEISVPLYYTGIRGKAVVAPGSGKGKTVAVKDGKVACKVDIPAGGWTWVSLSQGR